MLPSSGQRYQSPIRSNYDRFASTERTPAAIIPRARLASEALGMDNRHPTTPHLQQHSSQMSHGPIQDDEPDYRAVLDHPSLTPNHLQSAMRPQSSVLNSGEDPVAITNLITTIGGQFGLTPTQLCQIDKVFQQPDDLTRQIASLCYLTSQISNAQQSSFESPGLMNQQSNEVSRNQSPEPTREWKGEETVRAFIRETIKELLMKPLIQAYSTANAIRNDVTVDSLENLVIEQLMKPNTTVRDRDLPPRFRSNDLAAEIPVRKVIKEIAKSEKSKFQNGLLENIKDPKINTLVPTLFKVYFELGRTRGPKNQTTSKDMIWNALDIADKSRIALLRLEGTIYHLSAKNSTEPRTSEKEKVERSMWDRVDERLLWVRHLEREKQKAFYRWIMKYDAKLFTGKQTFEQVKQTNVICMVTPELLDQWMLEGEPALDLHQH
ncbi:hypothetical protein DFH28DRAFT_1111588 [Melampsora americana]|nr:hypothetical protein DFH28DRAFT_1111588 [Melampsora americana]